jgi:hypothetical protein
MMTQREIEHRFTLVTARAESLMMTERRRKLTADEGAELDALTAEAQSLGELAATLHYGADVC